MPSKLTVRYLPAAEQDLISILDWIAKDNRQRAIKFIESIEKRIGALGSHPYLGRVPRHQRLQNYGYRVLIIEKYLVFYVVRGKSVMVHRIIHGSRNMDDIL